MNDAEQFFYDHAGYGYDPATETPEQGREKCARKLAYAEAQRQERGWWVEWSHDRYNEGMYLAILFCVAPFTGERYALASTGACDAEDGDPYRRVIVAELACEALAEETS